MIAPLLEAMGGMLTALQPPPSLFEAMKTITDKKAGGLAGGLGLSSDVKTTTINVAAIGPMMTGLSTFIGTMVGSLLKFIPAIVLAVKKGAELLPEGKGFEQKLKMMLQVFDVVTKLGGFMGDMNKQAAEMGTAKGRGIMGVEMTVVTDMSKGMEMMKKSFGSLAEGLKTNLPTIIQAVMDAGKIFEGKDQKAD